MGKSVSGLPEEYFEIPPETPKDLNLDVLSILLARARSVLLLLEGEGADLREGFNLNHASVMSAIGCVLGHVAQAEQMLDHAISSDKERMAQS